MFLTVHNESRVLYWVNITEKHPKIACCISPVCLLCDTSPLPHVRWRKLDADLPPNYEVSMNGALLHLINVQYEDEGSYECEALNVRGMDWYRQWLYVEGKLPITLAVVRLG